MHAHRDHTSSWCGLPLAAFLPEGFCFCGLSEFQGYETSPGKWPVRLCHLRAWFSEHRPTPPIHSLAVLIHLVGKYILPFGGQGDGAFFQIVTCTTVSPRFRRVVSTKPLRVPGQPEARLLSQMKIRHQQKSAKGLAYLWFKPLL